MGEIDFIDKKLRSIEDIDEAIKALQTSLVQDSFTLKPRLVLALPTAIEALKNYRGLLVEVAKLKNS